LDSEVLEIAKFLKKHVAAMASEKFFWFIYFFKGDVVETKFNKENGKIEEIRKLGEVRK
jgi:hypothetical protein